MSSLNSTADWVAKMFHSIYEAEIAIGNIKDLMKQDEIRIEFSEFQDEIGWNIARFCKRANGFKTRAKS